MSIQTHTNDYPYLITRISKHVYRKVHRRVRHTFSWCAQLKIYMAQLNGSTKSETLCHTMSQLGCLSIESESTCHDGRLTYSIVYQSVARHKCISFQIMIMFMLSFLSQLTLRCFWKSGFKINKGLKIIVIHIG